jgi:hypothetical protein
MRAGERVLVKSQMNADLHENWKLKSNGIVLYLKEYEY